MRRGSLVIVALLAACTSPSGSGAAGPDPTIPPGSERAEIVAVLDGDSLDVRVGGSVRSVRLLGINTPEQGECFAARAREATTDLALGTTVSLGSGPEDRDQFGRLLRYVYLADGDLLNRVLVADGYALALTVDHPLLADFKQAEAEAFAAGAGRWAPAACGPATAGPAEIAGLSPDPPGPDTDDPNGEWVEIANPGNVALDLTGWKVRDESSQHRFEFPPGVELQPGSTVRVLSGCGTDTPAIVHWCAAGPVWSNQGDTAYLLDPAGNLVDRAAY